MRIGQGFDAHRMVEGRKLMLGGVEIPASETGGRGLEGHSDGDALLHAVADAVLGALGAGDLGRHFPSSDASLAGIASARIVERVEQMMTAAGYRIANLDATIIAQVPRLSPHQPKMVEALASLLDTSLERVNLKVTSTDHLGAIGREEGIAALATVLLEPVADPDSPGRIRP